MGTDDTSRNSRTIDIPPKLVGALSLIALTFIVVSRGSQASLQSITGETTVEAVNSLIVKKNGAIDRIEGMEKEREEIWGEVMIMDGKLRGSLGVVSKVEKDGINGGNVNSDVAQLPLSQSSTSVSTSVSTPPPAPSNLPPSASSPAAAGMIDFPCPLRDLPPDSACTLKCPDASCNRAQEICSIYVECDGVEMGDGVAVLKHTPKKDDPAAYKVGLEKAISQKFTLTSKPRTYVIISYGGSGSKMLSGWISDLPKSHVVKVRHMHDPNPPEIMREFNRPLNEATHQSDYRTRHIPGGMFPRDTAEIPFDRYDEYRYVFIFKDPVEGLVSRYGHGHCMHVGGDCPPEGNFPDLYEYAKGGTDWFKISNFFDNWTGGGKTGYPVVLLNYHKLWDNLPEVVEALGLPETMATSFPDRSETVRNEETGKREGTKAHSEEVRALLRKMYKGVREKIWALPAVSFV